MVSTGLWVKERAYFVAHFRPLLLRNATVSYRNAAVLLRKTDRWKVPYALVQLIWEIHNMLFLINVKECFLNEASFSFTFL